MNNSTDKNRNNRINRSSSKEFQISSFLDTVEGEQIWTPSSDFSFGRNTGQLIYGREGNDTIIGFDPGSNNTSEQKIDVLIGDLVSGSWKDRFVLGDWQQPYYVENSGSGSNQYAVLADVRPNEDIIQLHGTRENYRLNDLGNETELFWETENGSDLVALLPMVSGISLNDPLFQFEGNTPPSGPVQTRIQQFGTLGIDLSVTTTTDSTGNVYIAGATSSENITAGSYDGLILKYDSKGNLLSQLTVGTTQFDLITDIATDNQGNLYVAGITEGDLGSTKQGEITDVWLAKYDSQGNQQWIQQFGGGIENRTFSIDVDNNSNVYLSGYTLEENDKFRQDDSWVVKYDTDGNREWFTEFGTSTDFDEAYGVTVDGQGNVFSTGWTLGDLADNNAGAYDVWVAKHDNNGQLQWIEQFGSSDYEFPWDVVSDSVGNIYIAGWTLGNLEGQNAGLYDAFLTKYDTNGNQVWIEQFGTKGDDSLFYNGLAIDANDNLFLAGHTDGKFSRTNAGSYDTWVARYNVDGNRQWIRQFGSADLDYGYGITTDKNNNLYVTGITEGSLGDINAGSADIWVAQLSTTGTIKNFSGF